MPVPNPDPTDAPALDIGAAAARSGLSVKTIRYYEEIGLVRPARRANGYRAFAPGEVEALAFLARARALGFSVEECRALLSLRADRGRTSADVRALAGEHLARVEDKIAELVRLRDQLGALIARCHGDERPDCAILDDLSSAADPRGNRVPGASVEATPRR
ncbi:MAG: MerR family DNA-binding protein [Paracoccaceae bacterium]